MKGVVQFNEKHKWCGHFGYIVREKSKDLYLINTSFIKDDKIVNAYIFAALEEFDIIGKTDLITEIDTEVK